MQAISPKQLLREKIKGRLISVSKEDFRSQGEDAARLLSASPLWSGFMTIFLFLSLHSEIDTKPLLEKALKEGKKLFVPKLEAERMVFHRIASPDGPWQIGPLGIRSPAAEAPVLANDFPALVLSPGLAFDRKGNRLGRGGAYYDRFFAELDAQNKEYFALGFCMDFQILDSVPTEGQDKKISGLLTGKELILLTEERNGKN